MNKAVIQGHTYFLTPTGEATVDVLDQAGQFAARVRVAPNGSAVIVRAPRGWDASARQVVIEAARRTLLQAAASA